MKNKSFQSKASVSFALIGLGVALSYPAQAASFRSVQLEAKNTLVSRLAQDIGLSRAHQLQPTRSVQLPNGTTKIRYQQYYQGIPVYDGGITASKDTRGRLSHITGEVLDEMESDLPLARAGVSSRAATNRALELSGLPDLSKANIENLQTEMFVHQDAQKRARLVYEVSFVTHSDEGPKRPYYLIDAQTGQILDQWDGLTFNSATGPGGNEGTGKYEYGVDFGGLKVTENCTMSSDNVDTINMENKRFGGDIHSFDCPRNTHKAINGAFSPLNDAHYFGNVVFDMYKDWFDTAPLTTRLSLRVHYDDSFENAFWDGKQMTFGDGADRFYPLVSLDVVAHEVSHGFTEQNSDLMYRFQAGGINEAFSDMAGEAAEYYMFGENDWLVGSKISKSGEALRYMNDPTKDGRSIGHKKDYSMLMNVHFTSGVFNKAFYLLATTEGWNTEKAFRPFVLANQVYWKRMSTFKKASCGVIDAAKDLGLNEKDVEAAFNEVGVKCGGGIFG